MKRTILIRGASEALSFKLASQNILVNILEPSGGVTATRFSERMSEEHAADAALEDYADVITSTNWLLAGMRTVRKSSAEEVAQVGYGAATDETGRLSYFVGGDIGNVVQAKREICDEDYVDFMRSRFLAKPS
jgi:NAD(P)-dependent dehydrogenase (short-subunit alcohol dehydrogenase family)